MLCDRGEHRVCGAQREPSSWQAFPEDRISAGFFKAKRGPQEKGVYSRIEELHITLTSNPSSLSCDGE